MLLEPERLRRWRLFLFDLVGLVGVVASVCAPSCGGIEMISDPNFSIEISANRRRKLNSRAAASLSATNESQFDRVLNNRRRRNIRKNLRYSQDPRSQILSHCPSM